jgi:hypothetical protein
LPGCPLEEQRSTRAGNRPGRRVADLHVGAIELGEYYRDFVARTTDVIKRGRRGTCHQCRQCCRREPAASNKNLATEVQIKIHAGTGFRLLRQSLRFYWCFDERRLSRVQAFVGESFRSDQILLCDSCNNPTSLKRKQFGSDIGTGSSQADGTEKKGKGSTRTQTPRSDPSRQSGNCIGTPRKRHRGPAQRFRPGFLPANLPIAPIQPR